VDFRPGHGAVVLAHDYLLVLRGAERTFAAMADIWPDAPIHTLLYDEEGTDGRFAGRDVVTSALQRLHIGQDSFRRLLPIYPTAVRRMPLREHELMVSSSSAFAHGLHSSNGAAHVCYCHSPFRYAYHEQRRALEEVPMALRPVLKQVLRRHRRFDRQAVSGLTGIIANSRITAERIGRFWGRSAPIVHPPVEVARFHPHAAESEDLIFVGEVTAHKRVELALAAAERAGRHIRVIGDGPELPRLRERYPDTAEFLGRVDDEELERNLASSAALVVPNVEEFGIAAVEAQAAGTPVLAADAGGAQETVVHGETGLLVRPDDVDALADAMRHDVTHEFETETVARHAEQFSPAAFRARLLEAVDALT
jgi:glycosyltransferase involved in cell wall biosynthesis